MGCTPESTRIAIETQKRADAVQAAVFERQQDALKLLLYRDAKAKLQAAAQAPAGEHGAALAAALNTAWQERDLIEWWAIQFERSKALRLIGVDAALYSSQSIVDLLIKQLEAKAQRGAEGLAAAAGAAVGRATERRIGEATKGTETADGTADERR